MKNTVRVLFFLAILSMLYYLFHEHIEGGLLGYTSIIITLSVVFIGFVIFLENRHPSQTLTWLVVLGSFPLIGFIFYLLFGRNHSKEKMFREKYLLDKQTFLKIEGDIDYSIVERVEEMAPDEKKLFFLAQKLGNSPISFRTETRILTNGEETFKEIIHALKQATHHIHLEYYIVRHDQIGSKLKDILISKVREGVKVRFLYDAVGSWMLSKGYIKEMRTAGIEMIPFGPVHIPFLNNKFNFRNHRKIIVIDGSIGFVGGLNIGDEYLGWSRHFGHWRDTHLWIRGEAVRSLQLIFLQDWYYMTGKSLLTAEYLSPLLIENDHGGVQLIAGGPDNEWSVIKNIFFSMITSAKKSVWIASPYFIPDEDIFSAIKIAALSGIDVKLLVPNKPDKRIVFHASRSYFPALLEAGVKIYEYEKGFMHSKLMIVDDSIASIGTSNMDMRSFHLNFEVNAFLYHTRSTKNLARQFELDLQDASLLNLEEFKKRHLGYRLMESLSRLLSPFL
ncbi:cardiolipin synthase [Robertmurraya sp. DFI.2.37]|uniref:cardiolipin synthase n=1 Tax=Robertmurraya sp. DFI.2.37 TaxID=3031819 RepID=UPI0012455A38|nr:cardiolipin synthase [Robertmurraya sp. DFI.2.37]MDF1507454.1 cardiolipin synthase [Robertmurraya sp. DFI.2.37]